MLLVALLEAELPGVVGSRNVTPETGAVEALRDGFSDVAAWVGDGAGPGNAALVERGARAVTDLSELFVEVPEGS